MAKKKADADVTKNQYEAMFLLPAGATAEMEKSLAAVRGIIERHVGEVIVLKKWDERKLAYEIRAQKRGLYVIAYFTAPPTPAAGTSPRIDSELSRPVLFRSSLSSSLP